MLFRSEAAKLGIIIFTSKYLAFNEKVLKDVKKGVLPILGVLMLVFGLIMFSTAALMKLCEEGQITLDDRLSDYFPEFPADIFSKITVRDVLSHTSGLPDLRPRTAEEWDKYTRTNQSIFCKREDYRLYSTDKEHVQIIRDLTT